MIEIPYSHGEKHDVSGVCRVVVCRRVKLNHVLLLCESIDYFRVVGRKRRAAARNPEAINHVRVSVWLPAISAARCCNAATTESRSEYTG